MKSQKKSRGLARNVSATWVAFLFVAVVSFFLSPFVVRQLGNSAYGIWTLLTALVGYLGLLDFGVRGAVTRYVAHHHAAEDSESCSDVVSTGLMMFGGLGALAILLAAVFAGLAPLVFNIPTEMATETRLVLLVGGVTVASTLIGAVFGGVISGLQRFDIGSGVEILITTLRTGAIVYALWHGHGLVSLAVIHLAASVVTGLVNWTIAHRLYPELRLRRPVQLKPNVRRILSFSIWSSMIHISGLLIYYSDVLVIAMFLPVGVVTFYAIAGNLCDYARQLASTISMLMTPRVSALVSGGSERVGEEILSAARLASLVTVPIAATFWFRGESFINLWMGVEYGPDAGTVLRILAIVVLFGGARAVATASIMGVNRHRSIVPIFGSEAVANLALSVVLVGPLGLSGVALGTLIPSLVVSLGLLPRQLANATGVSMGLFYRNGWLQPIMASVPFTVVNILLERYLPAGNLLIFFVQILLTLPLVALGATAFCLTPVERKLLGAAIRRVVEPAR